MAIFGWVIFFILGWNFETFVGYLIGLTSFGARGQMVLRIFTAVFVSALFCFAIFLYFWLMYTGLI